MSKFNEAYKRIILQMNQQYQIYAKCIAFYQEQKIAVKNWIIDFINHRRYTTNIFKFDSYRALGIDEYSNGIYVISFLIKSDVVKSGYYYDWFPFKRFSQFTKDQIQQIMLEIEQWILSRNK